LSIKKKIFASIIFTLSIIMLGSFFIYLYFMDEQVSEDSYRKVNYMHASWAYNYSSIEELSSVSDVIALIRVKAIYNEFMKHDLPYTDFETIVISPILNALEGDSLVIRVTGGTIEEILYEIEDAPLLKIGDELIVFCRKNIEGDYPSYTIISGAQGRLYYSKGKLNSLCMIDDRILEANSINGIKIKDADYDETITQIRSYLHLN